MLEFVGNDEGAHHEDEGEQRSVGLRCQHLLHLLAVSVGGIEHCAVDNDTADAAVSRLCMC